MGSLYNLLKVNGVTLKHLVFHVFLDVFFNIPVNIINAAVMSLSFEDDHTILKRQLIKTATFFVFFSIMPALKTVWCEFETV